MCGVHSTFSRFLVVLTVGLAVTACSDSDREPDPASKSGPPSSTATTRPTAAPSTSVPEFTSEILPADCRPFMDRPAVKKLAGTDPASFVVNHMYEEPDSPYACEAALYGDGARGSRILLAVVPAHEAIGLFRPTLKEIDGNGVLDDKVQAAIDESLRALREDPSDDGRSCEVFSTLARELLKQAPGATYFISSTEEDGSVRTVGHSCTEGVYVAAVLFGEPGIADSAATQDRIRDVVADYSPGELTAFVKPEVDDSACELLLPATVEALAGPAAEPTPANLPGSGLPACRHGDELFVSRGPANDWLRAAPGLLEALVESGVFADRPAVLRRIERLLVKIERRGPIGPGEACAFAIALGKGADSLIDPETWVGSVPLGDGPPFIQFLRCRGETVSILVLRRKFTEFDEALAQDVLAALDEMS